MSTLIIKRRDGSDLPRGTRVRVVTYPEGLRTWKGVVSRAANVELDPGAYSYSIHKSEKSIGGKFVCWKEVETIYHDMTKEQYHKLLNRPRKHTVSTVTTRGNRWRCNYPGCNVSDLTNPVSGLVHELEAHYGENPLGEKPVVVPPKRVVVAEPEEEEVTEDIVRADALVPPKRGPGRPKKAKEAKA